MKAIAVIEILEGGKGKWYIDGQIRYTENESLIKKFDKELIPLKPLPQKKWHEEGKENECEEWYRNGWNDCIDEITGETE